MQGQQQTIERCVRCGTVMDWRHQTWQCPRCAFKLGCCEGEPQSCAPLNTRAPAAPARAFDSGASAASADRR